MSNPIRSISFLACALCFGSTLALAQDAKVYFGAGFGNDSALPETVNTVNVVTGVIQAPPSLNSTFGKIGGDVMINKRFGVGAETDFAFSKVNYLGLTTRPIFYDFNGVYVPFSGRWSRVVPEIQGGIGGVKLNFNYASCDTIGGCQSTLVESSSHFQIHVGAAVSFYATKHVFIRPAFDYHWVNNFFQFNSNNVPVYGASVGYSFSEH